MLNNTWIAPPQIRAECNWANKIFLSTYPWRGRVLRWQQLGPCHGASQVRDTLRDMWLSPGYRHHPMSRDTLPGCVTQTTRRWEQNIIWCQSHPLWHICWGQDIKTRYTTQIWETLMSTYRNKSGVSRFLQGRVALELDWQKQKLIPHI